MRYMVRQKVFAIKDSFTIRDEFGNDIFLVQGQFFSVGNKLRIFDLAQHELCYIEQQVFRFMPEYDIYIAGRHVANIKKKFAFFKNDFTIESEYSRYEVNGDIFAHEFYIFKDGYQVAAVSKKFFSLTDTYCVEVEDGQDQVSLLAVAIVIDMVCHDHDH